MNNLVVRYFVALATVFAVSWLYSIVAVPLVEGTVARADVNDVDSALDAGIHREDRFDLEKLLSEDAWELGSCIRLDTRTGQLLFKEYKQLEDGRLQVEPLTVILGSGDTEEGVSNPVIMRTNESAVLKFSKAFTFGETSGNQLESTWLKGEVQIFRKPSEKGDDGISITSSNISIDQQKVTAPGDVEFRFGPHFGRGRSLTIELVPHHKSYRRKPTISLGGDLGVLELVRLEHMVLVPPEESFKRIRRDESRPEPNASQDSQPERIIVICQGPFRFDFQRLEASFHDQVEVSHQSHTTGFIDRLTCDVLKARFGSKSRPGLDGSETDSRRIEQTPALVNAETTSSFDRLKDIELHGLEAVGQPAVFDLPNHSGRAEAEIMIYEPSTGRIYLKDEERVLLIHEEHQIEGLELEYKLTEDGRLGDALALGPGRIKRLATQRRAAFEASWNEELRIRPDAGLKAISLYGSTHLQLGDDQSFDAHDVHLWVDEIPLPKSEEETDDETEWRVVPTKMLATGRQPPSGDQRELLNTNLYMPAKDVRFNSPRLAVDTDRLEVFFTAALIIDDRQSSDSETGGASTAQEPASNSLFPSAPFSSPSTSESAATGSRDSKNEQKLQCVGDLTRLRLTPSGKEYQVEELTLGGNVAIREVVTESPDDVPVEIYGNVLQATSRGANYFYVVVQGEGENDASVSARGLTLIGAQINMDQLANQLWIDGPGAARLDGPDGQLQALNQREPGLAQARLNHTRPTAVTWRDRMVFDGETVQIDGQVNASGVRWTESGERMDWATQSGTLALVMTQRVDFADPGDQESKQSAEVARVEFDQRVVLNSDTFDPMGILTSKDELKVPNLSVDQISGEITSIGPGTARSTRIGGSDEFADPIGASEPREAEDEEEGLTFIDVEFAAGIVGNLHRREVHFVRNVDALVGSVEDWGHELRRDQPLHHEGSDQARLMCDRLIVAQWGEDATGKPMVEIQAVGNSFIAGRGFEATAAKVAFNQLQKMIILEGDQHAYAKLLRKINGVGTGDFAEAMKIIYWREQDRIEVDRARTINATYTGRLSPPRQMENR